MTVETIDAGPHRISRAVTVDAPADTLFDLLADPHGHSALDGSGTVQDKVEGPHHLQQGDRFTVAMKMFGVPYRITSRVVDLQEGRVIEWRHPAGHHWRWVFTPLGEHSTRVTETFDFSQVGAVQRISLELLGFPRRNGHGIEQTLERLQRRFAG